MLSVKTNISALSASASLGKTNKALEKSLLRISTGMRINKAADDAAGLGVATNLETERLSVRQGMRNTNDGISVITTAESSANEVTDILQRMRELAVQSSSETLDNNERSFIVDEFNQLRSEVDRIAANVEFNGINLGEGTNTQLDVQVGINNNSNSRITINLPTITSSGLAIDTLNLGTVTGAQAALDSIDSALDTVNGFRSELGSVQNRLESAFNFSQTYMEALSSAESQIRDTDFASETSELTKLQIMQQAGVASLAQAKNLNQSVISLLS
jgi:flagellin